MADTPLWAFKDVTPAHIRFSMLKGTSITALEADETMCKTWAVITDVQKRMTFLSIIKC